MTSGADRPLAGPPVRRWPRWWKLLAVAAVAAVAAAPLVHFGRLNLAGHCHAEGRVLGDEELLDAAIARQLYRGSGHHRKLPEIPYASPAEVRRLNPGCCELRRRDHPYEGSALLRSLGLGRYFQVGIYYRAYEGGPYPYYEARYWLTPCGGIWGFSGLPRESGPYPRPRG